MYFRVLLQADDEAGSEENREQIQMILNHAGFRPISVREVSDEDTDDED